MKPIYVFAILGVLFVLFVESKSSSATSSNAVQIANANAAAAQAQTSYGDSTSAIIGASVAGAGSLFQDFSGYGLD